MTIEILHRYTKAIIVSGEYASYRDAVEKFRADLAGADLADADLAGAHLAGADLTDADLAGAHLAGADLTGADLTDADLTGADLAGAHLVRANLTDADLAGAHLVRANLVGAHLAGANLAGVHLADAYLVGVFGVNPYLCTPLLMLLDQPTGAILRAYKLVNEESEGHVNGGLKYEIGKRVEVANADTDPSKQCAAGINVATLDWCMREWQEGYRILLVEFRREDIAAVPTATDGKFRLYGCTPIAEKNLKEIGLIKAEL